MMTSYLHFRSDEPEFWYESDAAAPDEYDVDAAAATVDAVVHVAVANDESDATVQPVSPTISTTSPTTSSSPTSTPTLCTTCIQSRPRGKSMTHHLSMTH